MKSSCNGVPISCLDFDAQVALDDDRTVKFEDGALLHGREKLSILSHSCETRRY